MHAGAGSWELVKKYVGGFLWCALVCAPSPVLASPVRIRIRLLNRLRDVLVQKVKEKRSLSCFFCVRKDVQIQGRSKTEERAEDVDYCLLLVEVQPPKEVEDA